MAHWVNDSAVAVAVIIADAVAVAVLTGSTIDAVLRDRVAIVGNGVVKTV
jgi:hypothetical protein